VDVYSSMNISQITMTFVFYIIREFVYNDVVDDEDYDIIRTLTKHFPICMNFRKRAGA
jgi:hypothetical protein